MFFKGSRYEKVENATFTDEHGRELTYKKIRFIKGIPASFEHTVIQGERLDIISYKYHKDPKKFWLTCDANKVMDPKELEEPGKRILIPPEKF